MKMRKFELVAHGGLCNRINAIASSYSLLASEKHPLKVYWFKNKELYCDFKDLFSCIEGLDVQSDSVLNRAIFSRYYHSNLGFSKLIRSLLGYTQLYDLSYKRFNASAYKGKKIYMATCHPVIENFTISDVFKPVDKLQMIIDNESSYFYKTFGVHVRRGDHIKAINENPVELFISKIEHIFDTTDMDSFFLATDSDNCKSLLMKKFGNRVITRSSSLTRSSTSGMQDALIELWMLGNSKFILGTRYSMFSKVASDINKVELVFPK